MGTDRGNSTHSLEQGNGPAGTACLAGWPWAYLGPMTSHSVKAGLEHSEFFPALNIPNPNYNPKHLHNEQNCTDTCLWIVKC